MILFCPAFNSYNASHILNNNSTLYDKFQQGFANAKGTPYIQEEYTLASISGLTTNYMVKYNAFNDEMELLLEAKKVNYIQKDLLLHTKFLLAGLEKHLV